ncbi:sterol desaturase family protein [Hazenella sp. IB182357]|uniref:Sterol desaturase family protein n=1 Tax=Polycladospora coralii TaxID=2771432 RepID=A0A926NFN9_9BACL|nr:sterol desaturase family protein [Polycladospora coralii]MBD1372684.1 sterol desaturase family protein [Polycladospora coralii]MBS7531078.1 sterol desaturase family protein [Polycladospora coralii]
MFFTLKLILYYLLCTLYSYLIHRLAHIPNKKNILFRIHADHHKNKYDDSKPSFPDLSHYFFWFGSWYASLDVWITLTLPILVITLFDPIPGIVLLILHYVYEVFLAATVLDHNPRIKGVITKYLAIGEFHLKHHYFIKGNYGFYITLWDYVFGTVHSKKR